MNTDKSWVEGKGGARYDSTPIANGVIKAGASYFRPAAALSEDLALELFDDIVGRDAECFAWEVRGPRIFRQLTGEWAELGGACAEEEIDAIFEQFGRSAGKLQSK